MSENKLFAEFPPVSTQEWEDVIVKDLKGADYEKKLIWKTSEGFNVKPYYRSEDLENISYLNSSPESFPFLRGSNATENDWEIRQDFRIKDIEKANALACEAVKKGVTGLGLCLKNVKTTKDFAKLLKGIDPCKTRLNFTCFDSYDEALSLFLDYLKENNIDPKAVRGSLEFDPIGKALLCGGFYAPFSQVAEDLKNLVSKYSSILPQFRLLCINAEHLHNSGATICQELGMALSWACDYMNILTSFGFEADIAAKQIGFVFASGSNYFMEIAKIRAARMLWANIAKEFKCSEEACKAHITGVSSNINKSVFDPYVNLLRSTTQTMSAAIAAADAICVTSFDIAYKEEDDFSARIARNQQIILKEESFMNKIVDPSAGSYYIESLTDSIAEHSWKIFLDIEEKESFAKAIESNYIQEEIEKSAAQKAKDFANRKIVLTGVNQYPNLSETMAGKIERKEVDCSEKPLANPCFKAIVPFRLAQDFEALRLRTEALDSRPKVFLLTYGNLAMRKARAGFASNFFGCAGYEVIEGAGYKTAEDGAKAALEIKADITVLCSSDEEYADLVAASMPLLKGKTCVVLAGFPKNSIEDFKNQGVEEFIHIKSNVLETLQAFEQRLKK